MKLFNKILLSIILLSVSIISNAQYNNKNPNSPPAVGISSGGPRAILSKLLNDGATVANYQPGIGVTGTLTASSWANQIGAAPALAAGNAPIYLPFAGSKYAYLPGVAGNSFTSPASTLTNFDIIVKASLADWTPAAINILFTNGSVTATNEVFTLFIQTNGIISCIIQSTFQVDGAANGFTDGTTGYIRVRHINNTGAGVSSTKIYTSLDGVTWTQSGAENTTASPPVKSPTLGYNIGQRSDGSLPANGKVYSAVVYDAPLDTTGVIVKNFNASDWPETSTNGATQVSSTTGETWTLNNTGAKLAQIVGSPQLLFDGTANYLATGAFTLNQPTTVYFVGKRLRWTIGDRIWDGLALNSMGTFANAGTPDVALYAGTTFGTQNWTLNTYGVLVGLYNGASPNSALKIDGSAAVTGSSGANNAGGFTLGASGTPANYGNIQVREIIIRNVADSAAKQAQIQTLLKAIHGTP